MTTKRYTVTSGAGTLVARGTNSKGLWMTVSIRRADGSLVAKRSAYSPVKVTAVVPKGAYSIGISARPSNFTLTVARPPYL